MLLKNVNKTAFLFFIFSILIVMANAQTTGVCKDNFNKQLAIYNKGQYENINNSMAGCISDILGNAAYKQRRDIVYKVYKMCVNAYRYLDQEKAAQQKVGEVAAYLGISAAEVEKNLAGTALTVIE